MHLAFGGACLLVNPYKQPTNTGHRLLSEG